MRLWVIGLLLIAAAIVTARALMVPDRRRRRGGSRWPWISWALIAVVLVPCVWYEWRWQATERTLTATSVWATGRPDAEVSCQRAGATMLFAGAEAGHVMWEPGDERGSGHVVWLDYARCAALRDWLESGKAAPTDEQIVSVHVATHELAHQYGIKEESRAECAAMVNDARVAEQLGATPSQALALAQQYAAQVWPHMPEQYRADCTTLDDLPTFGVP